MNSYLENILELPFEYLKFSRIEMLIKDFQDNSLFWPVVLIACTLFLGVILDLLFKKRGTKLPFGIKGKLVYADKGRKSKLFVNNKHNISAKPDFVIQEVGGEFAVVEYKNRNKGIYKSDIAQTLASVVAVRSKINVTKAYVVNNNEKREIDASQSTDDIYASIEEYVNIARRIKSGKGHHIEHSFIDNDRQCARCHVRNNCMKPQYK